MNITVVRRAGHGASLEPENIPNVKTWTLQEETGESWLVIHGEDGSRRSIRMSEVVDWSAGPEEPEKPHIVSWMDVRTGYTVRAYLGTHPDDSGSLALWWSASKGPETVAGHSFKAESLS